jgi:hypothetical protein
MATLKSMSPKKFGSHAFLLEQLLRMSDRASQIVVIKAHFNEQTIAGL